VVNDSVQGGLVVVRRPEWFVTPQPKARLERGPAVSAAREEIRRNYGGVDGEEWPQLQGTDGVELTDGVASHSQIGAVSEYLRRLRGTEAFVRLLFVRVARRLASCLTDRHLCPSSAR
jgi:hypothetical protein